MGSPADLTETDPGRFPSPGEITFTGETTVAAPDPLASIPGQVIQLRFGYRGRLDTEGGDQGERHLIMTGITSQP